MEAILKNRMLSVLFFLAIVLLSGCGTKKNVEYTVYQKAHSVEAFEKEGWRILTDEIIKEYDIKLVEDFRNMEQMNDYYYHIGTEGTGRDNMVLIRQAFRKNGKGFIVTTDMYKLKELPEKIYNDEINNINLP